MLLHVEYLGMHEGTCPTSVSRHYCYSSLTVPTSYSYRLAQLAWRSLAICVLVLTLRLFLFFLFISFPFLLFLLFSIFSLLLWIHQVLLLPGSLLVCWWVLVQWVAPWVTFFLSHMLTRVVPLVKRQCPHAPSIPLHFLFSFIHFRSYLCLSLSLAIQIYLTSACSPVSLHVAHTNVQLPRNPHKYESLIGTIYLYGPLPSLSCYYRTIALSLH